MDSVGRCELGLGKNKHPDTHLRDGQDMSQGPPLPYYHPTTTIGERNQHSPFLSLIDNSSPYVALANWLMGHSL